MLWPWQKKTVSPTMLALDLLEQMASKSGVRVTWETALQASTAFSCARVIADGIAQIPLKLYRSEGNGGATPATDHPLYHVVHSIANPWLTSYEWRETMGMHLAIANRSYAYINRVGTVRAQSIELLPLAPQQVRTERADDMSTRYFVNFTGKQEEEVPAERMLHLRGPSWNGWEGLDGVKLARDAIGLALATEEHGSRLFKNGATVGGILTTDANLNPEAAKGLRASWEAAQSGLANAYKTAVLWGGLKWSPRGMPNDQAQWIEVRRFQVAEVCRFYRVLPIIIGEADKTATYASSEQMFLAHVLHTMQPWYRRIEDRLYLQLLTPQEREAGYFFRFNMAGLLRGAHRDRAEYYRILHDLGALNANEIRGLEEMNPYDGGDQYMQPLNMEPVGTEHADPDAPTVADVEAAKAAGAADARAQAMTKLAEVMTDRRPPDVNVDVAAPIIKITLPEMTIKNEHNVEAPTVNLEATVPEAKVVIQPAPPAPDPKPRKTRTIVEKHDEQGRIVSTRTEEI